MAVALMENEMVDRAGDDFSFFQVPGFDCLSLTVGPVE